MGTSGDSAQQFTGVAMITGASSGIGAATARRLAPTAAGLVLVARREDRLQALCDELECDVQVAACDIRDADALVSTAAAAIDHLGGIDALVNNAGIMPIASFASLPLEDWNATIDTNVKGVLNGIAAVLPHMLERGTGHIINVSSLAGRRNFPGAAVYCGTKHAVHAISEGLRSELSERTARDGNTIRVTVIAPGIVRTELVDSITDDRSRQRVQELYDTFEEPLVGDDIAATIAMALTSPTHMEISELVVRPVRQVP